MLNSKNKDELGFIHVKCEVKYLLEKYKDDELPCLFVDL